MHKNKLIIAALSLFLLFSCSSDITGVVLVDDIYTIRVKKIMQEYTEKKYDVLSKFLSDNVKSSYSTDIFIGKDQLINVFKSDFESFSNIALSSQKIYSIYNPDTTYTTVFRCTWNGIGNYTKNTYEIISYYKFTWKDNKIITINTFWDDSAFYKEFSLKNKNV